MDEKNLIIPHPRLHERGFVLVPLAEIEPNFIHPLPEKPLKLLLKKADRTKKVILIDTL